MKEWIIIWLSLNKKTWFKWPPSEPSLLVGFGIRWFDIKSFRAMFSSFFLFPAFETTKKIQCWNRTWIKFKPANLSTMQNLWEAVSWWLIYNLMSITTRRLRKKRTETIKVCAVDRTVTINQIERTHPQLSHRPIRSSIQKIFQKRETNRRDWNWLWFVVTYRLKLTNGDEHFGFFMFAADNCIEFAFILGKLNER